MTCEAFRGAGPCHRVAAAVGAAVAALALLAAGCAASGPASTAPRSGTTSTGDPGSVPRPDHVVVVVEENHSYSDVIGNTSEAPFINALAGRGASFTQSFAVTHPSEPNYLALFSGSVQGVSDDSCPHAFATPNLGSTLLAAGRTFGGYSEDLPSAGYTGCDSGGYARRHNPWVNFSNVPASANLSFSVFPHDFAMLPTLSFVVPNLSNDMHDGSVRQGDTWLQQNLAGYADWAMTHNSLLVVTWDEDDNNQSNQIPTVVLGQQVSPGAYGETVDHYRLLRTLEEGLGLPPVGSSAAASPVGDIWRHG